MLQWCESYVASLMLVMIAKKETLLLPHMLNKFSLLEIITGSKKTLALINSIVDGDIILFFHRKIVKMQFNLSLIFTHKRRNQVYMRQ